MLSALLVLTLTLAAAPQPGGEEVTVVVHPQSRIAVISRTELSKIFLGRLRSWADGTPAVPIDQFPDRPARESFSRRVHRRSVVNVEVYWKRMIFSGRGVPPREVDSDQRVIELVASIPGAVGYVSASTPLAGVRALPLQE